jgi:hypothetical protein
MNKTTISTTCVQRLKQRFGIFSFTMIVSLAATTAALILSPVAYLLDTLGYNLKFYPAHTIFMFDINAQHQYSILIDGQIRANALVELLIVALIGVGFFFLTRVVVTALAVMWREFARFMLSANDEGQQPLPERREFAQAGYTSSTAHGND